MPRMRMGVPTKGMVANAAFAKSAPCCSVPEAAISGWASMVDTSTKPVMRQITTVDQNVPVEATSA